MGCFLPYVATESLKTLTREMFEIDAASRGGGIQENPWQDTGVPFYAAHRGHPPA